MSNESAPPLMTVGAFAAQVGRSVDWVRQRADAGHLPFVRDSAGRRMFTLEAVDYATKLIALTGRGPGNS